MEPEIFIPFVLTLAPVLIVLISLYYRRQQTEARYRTLVQLADKGVQLPQQWLAAAPAPHAERRRAFVLIGAGLGLMAMFYALPFQFEGGSSIKTLWAVGLLPLFTGLGYLASWWLNRSGEMRD
jgi:hypothetical protein